jgi:hypothetical protein
VIGISHTLPAGLDDQQAVLTAGVLRLVPLEFLVPHEAVLVRPVIRVGSPVTVELVRPDEEVALAGSRGVSGA